MRPFLCVILGLLALLANVPSARADNVQLTLDLRNAHYANALGGGTWQLFARQVETEMGAAGELGIASIRALINNIDVSSITFATGIGQPDTGGPFVNTLPNGTVEIIYEQELNDTVVAGVGVPPVATPYRDTLIASGVWPAGPRPVFGNDGAASGPQYSEAAFFGSESPPYLPLTPADNTLTAVVTLGDFNQSGTVSSADRAFFFASLAPPWAPVPFNPAGDMDQSGTVTLSDIAPFWSIFFLSPALEGALDSISVNPVEVPEPANLVLISILVAGLLVTARCRHNGGRIVRPRLIVPLRMMVVLAFPAAWANAGAVYFAGDVGAGAVAETGTIEVRLDLDATDSLSYGGVSVEVQLERPGIVQFTATEILNPSNRWPLAEELVEETSVRMFAASFFSTSGFPSGAQGAVFATVNYIRTGPGWTPLTFVVRPETLVDGGHYPGNVDVTNNYTFVNSSIGAPDSSDFDDDGDTDGRDFLLWQRYPDFGTLEDWQANYGGSSMVAAIAVPEPDSLGLGAITTLFVCIRRRRERDVEVRR